jgi:hypothetical protein
MGGRQYQPDLTSGNIFPERGPIYQLEYAVCTAENEFRLLCGCA